MDTLQLNRACAADSYIAPMFGGTLPVNDLPTVESLVDPSCFVLNSSPCWQPGTHWTALYIDPTNGLMEHFCSLGRDPPTSLLNNTLLLTYSQQCVQDRFSDLCGEYCILYLKCRCRGYSLSEFLSCFSDNTCVNDRIVREVFDHCILGEQRCEFV